MMDKDLTREIFSQGAVDVDMSEEDVQREITRRSMHLTMTDHRRGVRVTPPVVILIHQVLQQYRENGQLSIELSRKLVIDDLAERLLDDDEVDVIDAAISTLVQHYGFRGPNESANDDWQKVNEVQSAALLEESFGFGESGIQDTLREYRTTPWFATIQQASGGIIPEIEGDFSTFTQLSKAAVIYAKAARSGEKEKGILEQDAEQGLVKKLIGVDPRHASILSARVPAVIKSFAGLNLNTVLRLDQQSQLSFRHQDGVSSTNLTPVSVAK